MNYWWAKTFYEQKEEEKSEDTREEMIREIPKREENHGSRANKALKEGQ